MNPSRPYSRILTRSLTVAFLAVCPGLLKADATSYHCDVQTGSWTNQKWIPNTGTAPGLADGGVSTDEVTIDNTGSGAANLILEDQRTLSRLTRFRAPEGSPGNSLRLIGGSNGGGLTISDLFSVKDSALYLRAHPTDSSERLKIEADRLEIGSTEWNGKAPTGKSVASLFVSGSVGSNDESRISDYSRVTLKIATSSTIIGNGRFLFEGDPTGESKMDLGDVVFRDNAHGSETLAAVLSLGSSSVVDTDHRIRIRSLASDEASSDRVTVAGNGIVELYGSETSDSGTTRFSGEIKDGIRLEKTGTNSQILARPNGNSYSGGTWVSAGTLVVENAAGSGLGTGPVVIENQGILAGNGQITLGTDHSITVKDGGTLAAGKDGDFFKTLKITASPSSSAPVLKIEKGGQLKFCIGENNSSDCIEIQNYTSGALKLPDGGVEVILDGPVSEGVYRLMVFREGGNGSGLTASGLEGGFHVRQPSQDFKITFHFDDPEIGGEGTLTMKVVAASGVTSGAFPLFFLIGLARLAHRPSKSL